MIGLLKRGGVFLTILMHPLSDQEEAVHAQPAIHFFIHANLTIIQLIQRQRVDFLGLSKAKNEITPHLHLPLLSVRIGLDSVKEGPGVIGWQLELS